MIKCEKCGKHTSKADTSKVLTSYPPQYDCVCQNCGHHQYCFCSDYQIEISELNTIKHDDNLDKNIKANVIDKKESQTITGEKLFTTTKLSDITFSESSIAFSEVYTQPEIDSINHKIEKKIETLSNKVAKQENKYNKQEIKYNKKLHEYNKRLNKLRAEKWYFQAGQILLWKNTFPVVITSLINDHEYKYVGDIFGICGPIMKDVKFRQEDLTRLEAGRLNYIDKALLKYYKIFKEGNC